MIAIIIQRFVESVGSSMSDLLKLINSHVRHDLLNDLATIRSILEVYQDTKNNKLLEDVFKKVERSADFLKEMREVESMISEGDLKPLKLSDALKPIYEKYKEVSFNVQGDCTVMADDSLTSVFDNLVMNAINHGNADEIDIRITNGEICQVEFIDNGEGIPDTIRDRVFEKGVSTNGSGLGLYIVKKTVDRYGGSIQLNDNQQGTKFVMLFNALSREHESRDSGIDVLGNIEWGTHICHFYQTRDDLIDVLIPYFKAGLNNNEYCIWITSEFSREEAQKLVDEKMSQGMEVISYGECQQLTSWSEKLNQSLVSGYDGLRVASDFALLDSLSELVNYEEEVHRSSDGRKMVAVCSYPFDKCNTSEIADLTSRHHYTLVVREGEWELIENFEYRKSQNALQKMEEKYRALVENANEAIMVIQDGKIMYANPKAMEASGYSKEEIMFKPFSNFIHPADREFVINRYKERMSGAGADNYQFRFKDKSGNTRWIELNAASVEWDGKPAILNLITDITAQKEAEEKLERKSQEQKLLLDNMDTHVWYRKDVETYGTVNQAHACFLGLKPNELENKSLYEVFSKPEADKCVEGNREVFETKKKIHTEEWVKNAQGEERLLSITKAPKLDDKEEVDYIVCTADDITERKEYEEALKESEEKYRTYVDNSPVAIFVANKNGECVDVNNAACEMLGYTREEILNRSISELDESIGIPSSGFEQLESSGKYRGETQLRHRDGSMIYVDLNAVALRDGNFMAFCSDITERKEFEEALQTALQKAEDEKLKSEAVLESMGNAIGIVDTNFRFIYQNRIHREKYGEHIGEFCYKAIFDMEQICEGCPIEGCFNDGEIHVKDCVMRTEEGTKYAQNTASPLIDSSGEIVAGIESIIDLTEQRKAEESTGKAHAELNQVFNTAADGMRVIDKDFNVLRANDTFYTLSGLSKDELMKKKCYEVFNSSRCRTSQCSLNQILEKGRKIEYEDERKRVDGSKVPCIVTATPFRGADGELIGIVEDFKDITEWKKVEEKLQESEERYKATFEHTGTAMIVIEDDTTISMANKKLEEIWGYSKEEIEGKKSWTDFAHPDDLERMLNYHYARRKGEDAPKKYEFKLVDRGGNIRDIFITIDVIPGTKKSVASLMDVTYLRRLNRLLKAITDINEVVARVKKPDVVLDAVCRNLKLLYEDIFACVISDGKPVPIKSAGVTSKAINKVVKRCPSVLKALEGQLMKISTDSDLCQACLDKSHKYALSIPLIHEKQQGIITIHSNTDFSDEEVTLLDKLASNIAFALSAYEVEQDKQKAMEQLASNLTQFDMAADRLRNPLAIIMSALELKDSYENDELLEIVQKQIERIKDELDDLRREESATHELLEQSKYLRE